MRATQLAQIIAKKHVVEYEDRVFSKSDAEELFKKADRFYHRAYGTPLKSALW